ncbi:hypothetical protein AN1863.2 [Aspergillus nidulans FGSC A4]|uniref:Bys1 family protein (AFU_orthologue AFUA_2G04533) n=1 Tax=Emericella nidulans (strain FGSC A4 / ATCC 38163 / CBS 112.46 / NRRL 194 / M139) TaxID=227321 RepID=Q5BC67_EMENI|nr:hypothetical protein [Aspergillus nidulans FGSC A4]EAA65028.1 hypothetical protein AN1863.2 [Aspergillus nidulans FGSC A4]CBF85714.1 TPA: Bys1 family protein (AFU_orthologue; AFUA_2G04533) [Aspergillus nidulans FGSC A4]|eukprot:XP_659467.1 hypothetical protein AN1863.2 [Aspergillus nidulans FGSC A4]
MHFKLAAILSLAPLAFAGISNARILNNMDNTNIVMTEPNSMKTNGMETMKRPFMMRPATNETIAIGHAIVANLCEQPIYLWSVGQDISPQYMINPGEEYVEEFRRDPQTGGIAIKITTVKDGLYTSAPQTVFAYNLVEDLVWYDLSDVFGDPFQGQIVSIEPSEPEIHWENGVPPSGSQVRMLEASTDLVLSIC